MKKLFCILMVVSLMGGMIPSAMAAEDLLFGLSGNAVNEFWNYAYAGCVKAAETYGFEFELFMPPGGQAEEQKRWIESMVAKEVDGLAVSVVDPVNQTPFLNEIAAQVHLVLTDSDAPDSDRIAYVGMSSYAAGRLAGQKIKELLPDGGRIFIFVGRLDSQNAIERRQGIIDELKGEPYTTLYPGKMTPPEKDIQCDKWLVVDTLTDNADPARAQANAEDVLAKYTDIDLMIGLWTYNTPAIISALQDAGKIGEIKIVGFDAEAPVLQGIKDGYVAGTVVQDPFAYGYKSMEILYKVATGEDPQVPEDKLVDVPARYITQDIVDEFWATIKEQLAIGKEAEEAQKNK